MRDSRRPRAVWKSRVSIASSRAAACPCASPVVELCEIGAGGGSDRGCRSPWPLDGWPAKRRLRARSRLLWTRWRQTQPSPTRILCLGGLIRTALLPERWHSTAMPRARWCMSTLQAPLSSNAEQGSVGIIEIINENMASAAREHAIEVGRGLAGRTLIAIGGAASLHAADLAAKLPDRPRTCAGRCRRRLRRGLSAGAAGFRKIALPASAFAALLARECADGDCRTGLRKRPESSAGGAVDADSISLTAQMRYRGQGYGLRCRLILPTLRREGEAAISAQPSSATTVICMGACFPQGCRNSGVDRTCRG